MRSIWHSLAWKEWNEHKWKLVSILAVMWSLMVIVLMIAGFSQRHVLAESFQFCVFVGGIPMAIFVGLGIAAGEQSHGTLAFMQALPVPMWRLALHKLGFALLTLVVPVLVTMIVVVAVRSLLAAVGTNIDLSLPDATMSGRPFWSGSLFVDVACVASLISASLAIWAAACGVNRKDEVSAGAVALLLMALWWFVLCAGWLVLLKASASDATVRLRAVGFASAPLGFLWLIDIIKSDKVATVLAYATVVGVHIALAARYVRRFGRTDDRQVRSPQLAQADFRRSEFLPPPRRFEFSAIAWKQARETSPIALAGLLAVVGIVTCYCLAVLFVEGKWLDEAGAAYAHTATIFGFFIALVAGIGVSLNDSGSRLNTFWRSRPIQPDLWYWTKFVTGLLVVLAAIYLPIGFLALIDDSSVARTLSQPEYYLMPPMQFALFASAVMVTCLVRQAVYAAILSIAAVYLGILATLGAQFVAGLAGLIPLDRDNWWEPTTDLTMVGLWTTFVVFTLIAWFATRYDWGKATRY